MHIGPVNLQHASCVFHSEVHLFEHLQRRALIGQSTNLISVCTRLTFIGTVICSAGRFHLGIKQSEVVPKNSLMCTLVHVGLCTAKYRIGIRSFLNHSGLFDLTDIFIAISQRLHSSWSTLITDSSDGDSSPVSHV